MDNLEKKPQISHIEMAEDDDISEKFSTLGENELIQNARDATDAEHEMTAKEALRDYPMSVFWGIVMSSTIIMEGYDTTLIGSFFAYPSFQKKYGIEVSPGEYLLTGPWMSALGCGSSTGIIIALLFNGMLIERFGHKNVVLGSLLLLGAFIFLTFFAKNIQILLAGQVLCGIPFGLLSVIGLIYSSEIAPLPLRGFLSSYVMLCWATGQLVAAGVLKSLVSNTTEWAYRLPFAIQWVWIPPLFILTWFVPDSPYWLVRKGKYAEAENSIKALSSKLIHHRSKQKLNLMIYTNELEKDQQRLLGDQYKGWKGYLECFKGVNLRRTEIAGFSIASQVTCGNNFAYSPTYLFSQVGLSSQITYNLNLAITGIAFLGTCIVWFVSSKVGRRTIFLTGVSCMTVFLLLIAVLQDISSAGQVAMVFGWVVSFVLTLAPIAYTITSEVSSTRLRAQTIAIGRNTYNIAQLIAQLISPYFINPTELNLKGRTSYIWFGTSFLTLIWAYFRLPETKDRTYEELDILFEKRIPARKFSSYILDLDADEAPHKVDAVC